MDRSSLEFLFGKSTTTAKVVDEAPGEEEIPYKIPMKIIERVMDNRYEGVMTHKYRGSQQSSREVKPNLLIRHKGRQRTLGSLNSGVVNSAAPGNRLARKSLSVVTVL